MLRLLGSPEAKRHCGPGGSYCLARLSVQSQAAGCPRTAGRWAPGGCVVTGTERSHLAQVHLPSPGIQSTKRIVLKYIQHGSSKGSLTVKQCSTKEGEVKGDGWVTNQLKFNHDLVSTDHLISSHPPLIYHCYVRQAFSSANMQKGSLHLVVKCVWVIRTQVVSGDTSPFTSVFCKLVSQICLRVGHCLNHSLQASCCIFGFRKTTCFHLRVILFYLRESSSSFL